MGRAGQTKCQSSGRLELLYKSDPNITTDGGHMEIILAVCRCLATGSKAVTGAQSHV